MSTTLRRSARIAAIAAKDAKAPIVVTPVKVKPVQVPQAPEKVACYTEVQLGGHFHGALNMLARIPVEELYTCPIVRSKYHWALDNCAWAMGEILDQARYIQANMEAMGYDDYDIGYAEEELRDVKAALPMDSIRRLQAVLAETREAALNCYLDAEVESPWACVAACESEKSIRKYIPEFEQLLQ